MFKRRIGPHPHAPFDGGGSPGTSGGNGCPDVWELESGDFAVIGVDKTDLFLPSLPPDANCGPDERIVLVDRHVLVRAKKDIPEA